jgi:hypothetical protein
MISPGLASKSAMGFLVEPQNQCGGGFSGLGLKTGSSGLVIWDLKSPRQFLSLGLKIKQVSVYQLRHKTDGGRSMRDTRRDLAVCLTWKQVWLGFPVWPEDWRRHDDGWCTWYHRGGCIRGKLKTNGSMRRATLDPATLHLPFLMY